MKVRIITAQEIVADLEAKLITAYGSKGVFGVMESHMNFITNLKKSVVKIDLKTGESRSYYIHGVVGRVFEGSFDIFTEFAKDIEASKDIIVKEKIESLQEEAKNLKEDSLQMSILSNKIERYESLRSYLKK
jgi:F0F1-type ATP synthase epsilon subunit